jgi:hypothetical protein
MDRRPTLRLRGLRCRQQTKKLCLESKGLLPNCSSNDL